MTETVSQTMHCDECGDRAEIVELDHDSLNDKVDAWHAEHRDCDASLDRGISQTWQEFADLAAEPVAPAITPIKSLEDVGMTPRPSWSNPDEDHLSSVADRCTYRSSPLALTSSFDPLVKSGSVIHGDTTVAAALTRSGQALVVAGMWGQTGGHAAMSYTPAEARRLARMLAVAADLAESELEPAMT